MTASDLKADRKLDILSRTIATPAIQLSTCEASGSPASVAETDGSDEMEATPEADTTMDESFASALDRSHLPDDGSLVAGRMSDPFLVTPQQIEPHGEPTAETSETGPDETAELKFTPEVNGEVRK